MILRSITEHVKTQNWFAVGLDFLIVVVGVFMGIQVSNWNAARSAEKTAQEYIVRIQDDLLSNQEDMTTRIEYFTAIRQHALGALEALDDPPESLGQPFIIDSYIASTPLARRYGRDTYDELLSAGAGNTALDVAIRHHLAQYYRVTDSAEFFFLRIPPYYEALRSHLSYKAQSLLRQGGCSITFGTDDRGEPAAIAPTGCRLDLAKEEASMIVARLLEAGLEPELTFVLADIDLKLYLFQTTIERAQVTYAFLEESKK